jgi:hypothetical protein
MALMSRTIPLVLLVLTVAAACERRHPPDPRPMVRKALAGVLVYPLSTEVDIAAGEDAAQATLASADSVGKVANWFRRSLVSNGWSLQSDITNADGSVSISASQGKRPLWVTLRPRVDGSGTTYTVIGGIVPEDSEPADTSSKAKTP